MEQRTRRSRGACIGVLVTLAACAPAPRRAGEGGGAVATGAWHDALQRVAPVLARPLPAPDELLALPPDATLLVVDGDELAGEVPFAPAQRDALRAFVRDGGRLLLFGCAARLAAAIGVDEEWPEVSSFRWGYDRRAAIGSARLGVRFVSGKAPELFESLQAAPGREQTCFVTGGQPCDVPLCCWSVGAPRSGDVLGCLATELDGEPAADGGPVVVRWNHGRGEVLACGLLPALDAADANVRDNARAFVTACVKWLQRRQRGAVVVMERTAVPAPELARLPSPFEPAVRPALPLVSHWGWRTRIATDGALRPSREVIDDVLLPSWRAGATALELELADTAGGVPLVWRDDDPMKRPPSWHHDAAGGADGARRGIADLAGEAHARGMLVLGAVDPLPVGPTKTERLVALRFLARELADVRRNGAGALDGFGVRQWWPDHEGHGVAMLQDFAPGALLYASGELGGAPAGGLRALDADDGALRDGRLPGLTAGWRAGFRGDRFPLGVLDARAVRSDTPRAGDVVVGGGSRGDWLVAQANDFVRARRGRGAVMWWREHDAAAFDPTTVAYVHGLSQEPLVAAVASNLATTGNDGRRAATAASLDRVPDGFGAEANVPAAVHVLQNNWFQLAGSGGALRWDGDGLAAFRGTAATTLAPVFLRTRLFGARPSGDMPSDAPVDLLGAGRRGEGGYAGIARIVPAGARRGDGAVDADVRVPTVIAAGETPKWPNGIAIDWRGEPGYHELEVVLRAVRGNGVVEIAVDGTPVRCVPFRDGVRAETVVVPLHASGSGLRTLQLQVVEGGACAIDTLRTVRRGEVGAMARVLVPAGSHARLEERSSSSVHDERLEFATIADFPGFALRLRCDRAVRGLQVERTFAFPAHRRLAEVDAAAIDGGLRQPFALRADDRALPDVVVVPLQMARHDRFAFTAGELVLRSAPEGGMSSLIGFLFCERTETTRLLRAAAVMFAAIDQPLSLDLGATGEARVVNDLPLAWPRLVHLAEQPATPLLVCENGTWTWRGTQAAPDGGAWLRVHHAPGDTVQIVGGPGVFARTRPGPGSADVVALRDVEPLRATAIVVQPSLLAAPCIVMGADFDEVRVDGEAWAWFSGRTVFLPDRAGTHRVECRARGGAAPHVLATRAPLQRCAYDAERRALVLVTASDPDRPVELPWTAVLYGPRPTRIENGEVVDDATLRLGDPAAAAAVRAGGTLIRFRSGITEVFHGP